MKLKTKFIIFVVVVNVLLILLSLPLIEGDPYRLLITEAVILLTLGLSIHLYREFVRPLNLISDGIESLNSQDFNTKLVEVGQVEMNRLIVIYNHMITQLREEKIRQQEQHFFLERLIQASPSGIIILDFEEKMTSVNPAGERLLQVTANDIIGKMPRDFKGELWAVLAELKSGESKIITKNGIQTYQCQKSHFVDRGFHHHFIMLEELTEAVIKSEKRAYNKVIRMMSHEINNSIGAVNSILDSVLNFTNQLQSEGAADYRHALEVAIERNKKLNQFMTNFADVVKIPAPVKETCNVHQLMKNVHLLLSGECSKQNITITWKLAPEELTVSLDVRQMEQVLMNVLKNAIEAAGQSGEITIGSGNGRLKYLKISNNGPGIPSQVKTQIFSPFFSTKKDGQGVGLTLTREVLMNHGFHFSLDTKANGLTEFVIEFV